MRARRGYVPHCPARDCEGGDESQLYEVRDPGSVGLTPDILRRRAEGDATWRCLHCGFIWFQKASSPPGFEAKPAGYFDHYERPDEFFSVRAGYPIRDKNERWYWAQKAEKSLSRNRRARP